MPGKGSSFNQSACDYFFFQAILEKYSLGQQRLPMEVSPAVPLVQQTAPQPTPV